MRSKLNDFINMSTALYTGEAEAGTLYREGGRAGQDAVQGLLPCNFAGGR